MIASTHYRALMHLPSRIKSSLTPTEIEFPKYTRNELFDMLKDRVEFSFKPHTLKDASMRIAAVVADGDARVGLEILRRAEDRGKDQVTIEEIKDAAKEARMFRKSPLLSRLNEHERIIYDILERKKKLPSGELYEEYCKLTSKPVVDRAYRNYMNRMVELGLVAAKSTGRWKTFEIVA